MAIYIKLQGWKHIFFLKVNATFHTYFDAEQSISKTARLLAVRWSDLLKAFIINLLYIKSCHLANLLILSFPLNTYNFKHLVSIVLLNKLPFSGFGSTAISAKYLQIKIIAFIKPLIICYLPILLILAFLVNSYYQFWYIFSKS